MGRSDGQECTEEWRVLSIVSARGLRNVSFQLAMNLGRQTGFKGKLESLMANWKIWKLTTLGRAGEAGEGHLVVIARAGVARGHAEGRAVRLGREDVAVQAKLRG